jgi:hypothetical protein
LFFGAQTLFHKKTTQPFQLHGCRTGTRRKLHTSPLHIIATQHSLLKCTILLFLPFVSLIFFLHFNTVRATSPHIFALHNILGSRPRARMLSCSASLLERVTTYVRTAPIALHQTRMACHVRLYSNERFRVKLYCFPLCFVSVYWTFRSPVTMYYPNRKTRRIFTQICREIGRFSQKVS